MTRIEKSGIAWNVSCSGICVEIEPCGEKGNCCYGECLLEECGCRRRSWLGDWDANMNGADGTRLMEEWCVSSILIIGQGRENATDIVGYGATTKPLNCHHHLVGVH